MFVVVGLGNPGPRYADTRHNVGFRVVEALARRWSIPMTRAWAGAVVGDGNVAGQRALLAMPQQFMNCSGQPVATMLGFYKVAPAALVVVHDDMDLPFERIRVRSGGGHGGHNGIRDILRVVSEPFLRVKVGVGRPPAGWNPADYVLGSWTESEKAGLEAALSTAADAVESLLKDGLERTMNFFNPEPATRNLRAAVRN